MWGWGFYVWGFRICSGLLRDQDGLAAENVAITRGLDKDRKPCLLKIKGSFFQRHQKKKSLHRGTLLGAFVFAATLLRKFQHYPGTWALPDPQPNEHPLGLFSLNNNAPSPRKRAQGKRTHCSRDRKTWYSWHFVHAHTRANKADMQPDFT